MKKLFKILLITSVTSCVFNFAEAQRSRGNSGSGDHGNRGGSSQSFDRGSRGRATTQAPSNRGSYSQRSPASTPQGRSVATRSTPQRTFDPRQNNNRQYTSARDNRSYVNNSNYRYNNYNNRYNNYNGRYGNSYRTNYSYRPVFMHGPRYSVIPRSSVSIYFGGSSYYYNSGLFYGYYGGFYQPLFPPFGLRIGFLPYGYSTFYMGANPFYYSNGIYYRQYNDNSYEVVDAPMGATVSNLPKGAKSVVVNGEKLYELNGTYYKADRDSNGNDVYVVVGKNGEINNTNQGDAVNPDGSYPDANAAPVSSLQMGDVVSQLPEGSKVVTINGEKTYVTPDNTYLEQESTNNGVVQYKVVGK
jgi:hypothetical protein